MKLCINETRSINTTGTAVAVNKDSDNTPLMYISYHTQGKSVSASSGDGCNTCGDIVDEVVAEVAWEWNGMGNTGDVGTQGEEDAIK